MATAKKIRPIKLKTAKLKTSVKRTDVKKVVAKTKLKKEPLALRMYSFVIYQLSGIQAGIQAGHATTEYQRLFGKSKDYKRWCEHPTVILLNGGTTNESKKLGETGTIQKYFESLKFLKVTVAPFYEPD